VVNPGRSNYYVALWYICALLLLGIGVGITVSSFEDAEANGGGFYVVMYGPSTSCISSRLISLVIGGVCLLLRAVLYSVWVCNSPPALPVDSN
jgi:hypothetical protein